MVYAGYTYKAKFVRHHDKSTTFQISAKTKNPEGAASAYSFEDYGCTVWGGLDLIDGQKIKIIQIKTAGYGHGKNGKTFFNLGIDAEVLPLEEENDLPQSAPASDVKKTGTTAKPGQGIPAQEYFPGDDEQLPFDI